MTNAFIFPGQGSQFIGMGKDLAEAFPDAKAVFQEVDDALGKDLSGLMFGGEEADLNMTENTQPALMAVSMAVVNVLQKQGGVDLAKAASFVAGHSLGEYAALTAAGALKLSDTAKLLQLRGQAMQRAVPVGEGAMAALLGLENDVVDEISKVASETGICEIANDNSPGQIVVSGQVAAVEAAAELAKEKGAKRAVILPVSAPFHCSLMNPAAEEMAAALADTDINAPVVPVVANVTAKAENDPDTIRNLLIQQITGRVRWSESVVWMGEEGVTEMAELGAGKVLSGLVRRINKEISCESVGTPEQVEALIAKLS
ncbi:MAG: ACP S-malonyltransferase [Alphaproteobacteria bacterium]|nr:ACP S-malonyltransferase [Alphaproteobacteria bacterium]